MNEFIPEKYSHNLGESSDWHRSRLDLWIRFCQKHQVAEDSVPFFECDESGSCKPRKWANLDHAKYCGRSRTNYRPV
jgi:hypothetical protein